MTTNIFTLFFSPCSSTGLSSQPLWSSFSTSNTPVSSLVSRHLLISFLLPETFPSSLHVAGAFLFFILSLTITSSRKPSLNTLYKAVPPFIPLCFLLAFITLDSSLIYLCLHVFLSICNFSLYEGISILPSESHIFRYNIDAPFKCLLNTLANKAHVCHVWCCIFSPYPFL